MPLLSLGETRFVGARGTASNGVKILGGPDCLLCFFYCDDPGILRWCILPAPLPPRQALMEALEGMEGMELTPGGGAQSKDVLKASSDVLPNRSPFEMQYELFKRGMELEDDDDFVGAERQWTEIIENFNSPNFRATSPGNKVLLARAYSNRGNTRLSLQKTREAILDYSESIDLVPEKGEFWLARGVAFEVINGLFSGGEC